MWHESGLAGTTADSQRWGRFVVPSSPLKVQVRVPEFGLESGLAGTLALPMFMFDCFHN